MSEFNEAALRQELEGLPKDKRLAFVILVCERALPLLIQFSAATNFSDFIYKSCLEVAWRHLDGNSDVFNYADLAAKCLRDAPDTEKLDHPLTSAALNAALSIEELMEYLADCDISHIMEVTGLAIETAAAHAQSISAVPPSSLTYLDTMVHPLVQQERMQQLHDLNFLKSAPALSLIKDRAAKSPALLPWKIP